MTRILLRVVLVAGWVLAGQTAWAQVRPSAAHREVRGQIGASINNAGLQNSFDVTWLWPTSKSQHPLLSGAHIATGVTQAVTPSQAKLGGWVEYSPLSILDVRAGVDPWAYFGTFNSLMGFASYDAPFDPDSRKARGGGKAGVAARAYVAPTLKWKAGPIMGSSTAEFEWWRSSAAAPFFYEPTRDTLLQSDGDRMINTTNVLMYQFAGASAPVLVGAIHTLAQVPGAADNRIQKLGVIAVKEFASTHYGLPRPRLTIVVARYLEDPFKQDQWTAAIGVGFRK